MTFKITGTGFYKDVDGAFHEIVYSSQEEAYYSISAALFVGDDGYLDGNPYIIAHWEEPKTCGGRTDGYGGFTCVSCDTHYERDEEARECKGKHWEEPEQSTKEFIQLYEAAQKGWEGVPLSEQSAEKKQWLVIDFEGMMTEHDSFEEARESAKQDAIKGRAVVFELVAAYTAEVEIKERKI